VDYIGLHSIRVSIESSHIVVLFAPALLHVSFSPKNDNYEYDSLTRDISLGATIGSRYPTLNTRIWKRVNKLEKIADEMEDPTQRKEVLTEAFILTGGKWPASNIDAGLYCIWHALR
jgi:hypothetical protein